MRDPTHLVRRVARTARSARRLLRGVARLTYSQEGEDRILARYFEGRPPGFYVDVGAHHPLRYSNTQLLYENGWRGLNIEPNPAALKAFEKERVRDMTLTLAVSDVPGTFSYYMFDDPALNTLERRRADWLRTDTKYRLIGVRGVEAKTLAAVLAEHVDGCVDVLTVDTEGHDLAVLRSNDWIRFRPEVIVVEAGVREGRAGLRAIEDYLRGKDYVPFASTVQSVFYRSERPHLCET